MDRLGLVQSPRDAASELDGESGFWVVKIHSKQALDSVHARRDGVAVQVESLRCRHDRRLFVQERGEGLALEFAKR